MPGYNVPSGGGYLVGAPPSGPEPGSIVPGSFRSSISLGQRYVPAPNPWQAAWNTLLRNYAPWGPLTVDPPPTGTGGAAGKILGLTPYVGGGFQALMAKKAAEKQAGKMVPIGPMTGWTRFQDIISSIQNLLGFIPGVPMGAKVGAGVASGLVGAPEFFGTSWGQALGRGVGLGAREIAKRVAPRATAAWTGGPSAYESPFVPGESVVGQSFGTPVSPYNPFVNSSTGLAPTWSLFPGEENIPRQAP